MELGQERVRLGFRKRFFSERAVRHCNRPPREVVAALSLAELKKCLDNASQTSSDFWVVLRGSRS